VQKITFGEMRDMGARGIVIHCDSHSLAVSGDRWPDEVRLSDIRLNRLRQVRRRRAARFQLVVLAFRCACLCLDRCNLCPPPNT
jgi:hypothetical protein